jgi:hypothetical protein
MKQRNGFLFSDHCGNLRHMPPNSETAKVVQFLSATHTGTTVISPVGGSSLVWSRALAPSGRLPSVGVYAGRLGITATVPIRPKSSPAEAERSRTVTVGCFASVGDFLSVGGLIPLIAIPLQGWDRTMQPVVAQDMS